MVYYNAFKAICSGGASESIIFKFHFPSPNNIVRMITLTNNNYCYSHSRTSAAVCVCVCVG